MKKLILILVLALCGWCWGATKYVDFVNGDDQQQISAITINGTAVTKAGAFADSVTWAFNAGDHLRVVSGTGATTGYYTITARPDNDTLTISGNGGSSADAVIRIGNNGTTATVSTPASTMNGPVKTLDEALFATSGINSGAANGDTVQLADSTSYVLQTYLNFNTDRDLTIQGNASNRAAVKVTGKAGQSYLTRVNAGMTACTLTFKNMTLQAGASHSVWYSDGAGATGNTTFDNCTINGVATQNVIYKESSTGNAEYQILTLSNCQVNHTGTGTVAIVKDSAGISITDTTFTTTSGILAVVGDPAYVVFNDNIITAINAGSAISPYVVYAADTLIAAYTKGEFLNNQMTVADMSGFYCTQYAVQLRMENNTYTSSIERSGRYAYASGVDSQVTDNANGEVYIDRNTCTMVSDIANHGLLIGGNSPYAKARKNTINSGGDSSYGLIVKSDRCLIEDNVVTAGLPIDIKAANYCIVSNNTCVSNGVFSASDFGALKLDADAAAVSTYNDFTNNIFYNSLTSDAVAVLIADGCINNKFNWNDYYCGATATTFYFKDVTTGYTLTEMTTATTGKWATLYAAGMVWNSNDANSISVNPNFKNAAAGDYTPTNKALKLDDNTWIGGTQPEGGSSPFSRTRRGLN